MHCCESLNVGLQPVFVVYSITNGSEIFRTDIELICVLLSRVFLAAFHMH